MFQEARISGTIVLDHRAAYEKLIGRDVMRAAIEELAEDRRREYLECLAVSWVRISTTVAIIEAAGRLSGRDPFELNAEATRMAAEKIFNGVWRVLLRLTSDEALVTRAPVIYARAYDTGKLTAVVRAPGRAELTLVGWPDIHPTIVGSIAIGTETVLRLAGRKNVAASILRTGEGALCVVNWQV
jgi:hypothetical protein